MLKELHGWGWTDIHEYLNEDQAAKTIGYDTSKFKGGQTAPSRTTISRAWNDYFGPQLKDDIITLCEWIREYARAKDNLIGDLMVEPEDRTGDSERTRYRIKRKLAHETADKFRDLFYEELDINLPENTVYSKEELYDFFLHIALTGDFANNGADTWQEEVDDETTAPSGDTLRRYLRMFDELEDKEVTKLFDAVDELLWEIADKRGFTDCVTDVAVDGNAWLFYGDEDTPRIAHVDPNQGTDKAYEFLTLSVIGDKGEKFTVGVRQVSSRQEKIKAVKDLLEEADERLYVGNAMFDRGFYGTLFAKAINETGVNFVIRTQLSSKTKEMWEKAEGGVYVERDEMSRGRAPYVSEVVTKFVVPARDDTDAEYMSFISNRILSDNQARQLGEKYKRRWGIETSYRVIGDFLPKTASKDLGLRVWYYRMAVLLYNVWVLVNGVVADSLGLDDDASPPVTAKYMLTVLRSKHGEQSIT